MMASAGLGKGNCESRRSSLRAGGGGGTGPPPFVVFRTVPFPPASQPISDEANLTAYKILLEGNCIDSHVVPPSEVRKARPLKPETNPSDVLTNVMEKKF